MRHKKLILIVLALVVFLLVGVWAGMGAESKLSHSLAIAKLLQPLLEEENRTMQVSLSANINDTPILLESDVSLVKEGERSYLCIQRQGAAVYLTDNLLLLENGKAFRIGERQLAQATSYKELLPYIGALYEELDITARENGDESIYSVAVTGEQMKPLLEAASLGISMSLEGIKKLNVSLAERKDALERISIACEGKTDGIGALSLTLSDFRTLEPGEAPIPAKVQEQAASVDPGQLFSLTEDLYRLVMALAPFAGEEPIQGTLVLTADCGPIQLDLETKLSELKTSDSGPLDPDMLQALPEMLAWLALEGDIQCTGDGYRLTLDQRVMEELCRSILPEVAGTVGTLTEGSLTILLAQDRVASMEVSIQGKINALIASIPMKLTAGFHFA